jgi:hypothetical protein
MRTVAAREFGYERCEIIDWNGKSHGYPIALDDAGDWSCDGDETSFTDCTVNDWFTNDCGHWEDVGLDCFKNFDGQIKIHNAVITNGLMYGGLLIWGTEDYGWGTFC